ncbi:MAG: multicopper oxidase [Nostocaceae cyanobacterium]|nr:multicopper oxidase [Nostocaceae cyanobacterium]
MFSRRQFFQTGAAFGSGLILANALGKWTHAQTTPTLLDAANHPKFVNSLPVIKDLGLRVDLTSGNSVSNPVVVSVKQFQQNLLGTGFPDTTVWGYQFPGLPATYPGATIVARKDTQTNILWHNKLPKGKTAGHILPLDRSTHLAKPILKTLDKGFIPIVTHLHGGHTESASDGEPEAWFTQNFTETGPMFVKRTYTYDNDQEAATIWYHDHALGITRLNVYAGMAGFYLIRDDNEQGLIDTGVLPKEPYEIEIVIQDRMFTANGELYYPTTVDEFYEPGEIEENRVTVQAVTGVSEVPPITPPTVLPEFFGNVILVNGKAWPKLEVEPRKYRFRFLNGSDSRFYILKFANNMPFLVIGTDNGLLPQPVEINELLIAPGERYDLIVNFNGRGGEQIILQNFGPDEPFKGLGVGDAADPATTGQIMRFDVNLPLSATPDATVSLGTSLRPDITPLIPTPGVSTRKVVLFEGLDEFGRLQPILGTLADGSLTWFQPITENPRLNDVEIWEIYNATEDAHPIHLHLVAFQIINRESFTGTVTEKLQPQHDGSVGVGGILTGVVLGGDTRDPEPREQGWKDTVVALPGEVTRIIAKFDRPGPYVWHCHILSHEDHEMMRPYKVI